MLAPVQTFVPTGQIRSKGLKGSKFLEHAVNAALFVHPSVQLPDTL